MPSKGKPIVKIVFGRDPVDRKVHLRKSVDFVEPVLKFAGIQVIKNKYVPKGFIYFWGKESVLELKK